MLKIGGWILIDLKTVIVLLSENYMLAFPAWRTHLCPPSICLDVIGKVVRNCAVVASAWRRNKPQDLLSAKTSEKVCCHGFRDLDLQKTALLVKDSSPMVHFSQLKQPQVGWGSITGLWWCVPASQIQLFFHYGMQLSFNSGCECCICVVNQPRQLLKPWENLRINRMCVNNTVANLFGTFRTNNLTYFS